MDANKLRQYKPYAGSRLMPAGCDQQQRFDTRPHRVIHWPDTVPTDFGTGYSELAPVMPARAVPCSTLARWWLAFKAWL